MGMLGGTRQGPAAASRPSFAQSGSDVRRGDIQLFHYQRRGYNRGVPDDSQFSGVAGCVAGAHHWLLRLSPGTPRVRPVDHKGQPLSAGQELEALGLQQLRAVRNGA